MGVEGTTFIVVTTIDGTGHTGILTRVTIVHIRLIDIASRQDLRTVSTTEDILDIDGRLLGHIHNRTTGDTLLVTATVSGTHRTTQQVDDG